MAIPATYPRARDQAIPGQVGDTSLNNFDGRCVADPDGANIPAGRFVSLVPDDVIDDYKVVTLGGTAAYGVTKISHAYAPKGYYEPGIATNVMTHGRIWVECAAGFTADDAAFKGVANYDATGKVAATGTASPFKFTGRFKASLYGGANVAEVQLLQQ